MTFPALHSPLRARPRRLAYRVRYGLLVACLETIRFTVRWMPIRAVLGLGRLLGLLCYFVFGHARRLARKHLLQARVARDRREATRLVRQMFQHLGMVGLEWLASLSWSDERLMRQVEIEGREHLEAALAHGRGLIVTSGHFGNWELGPRILRILTGRPIAVVMTPQAHSLLNVWMIRKRSRQGVQMVLNTMTMTTPIRHLRKGGIFALIIDQDSRRWPGVFVEFFGRPAYTAQGPAQMAVLYRATILPMTLTRDVADPTRYRAKIHPPINPDPHATPEVESLRLTQAVTTALETEIRRFPAQWVWLHKRWRHQPGDRIRKKGQQAFYENDEPAP